MPDGTHGGKGNGQEYDHGLGNRQGVEIEEQKDKEDSNRNDDEETGLRRLHVLELAAPDQLVARRKLHILTYGFLGIYHIATDVSFGGIKINVNITRESAILVADHRRAGFERDIC